MKRALFGAAVAFAVLFTYAGLCAFVAWGSSPAEWEHGSRFIVGVVGVWLTVAAFAVAYIGGRHD